MASTINRLISEWPKGAVGTADWLQRQGVSRQLTRRYVESGWLKVLGRGAFLRATDEPDWLGGVYALQHQLGLRVHVAAETALSLKGLGQYLPLGNRAVAHLFTAPGERLPAWFVRYPWEVPVQRKAPTLFRVSDLVTLSETQRGDFKVWVSSPEQAIMEVMYLATSNDAIDHAVELSRGLSTLRPNVIQTLLQACRSVKVKRLFLWAADSAGHAWLERLDLDSLDLGKGKRSLYRGGQFDTKYQITVPRQEGLPDA